MSKLLFSFDLIFDTEYGLYKHIMENYDEAYFSFKQKSDEHLKNLIVYRSNPNPLYVICTNNTKDNIDQLYKDFFESEYDDILKNSIFTNISAFIKILMNTNRYDIYILCKNIHQEQLCKKNNLKPITENINETYKEYFALYFRYFEEVDLLSIEGMNVYFANTLYNILNKDKLISINNNIRFIDLYTITKPK